VVLERGDHAVVLHHLARDVGVVQIGLDDQVLEQRVVPGLDMVHGLVERHVQHRLLPEEVVERDLDQAGGLAHAGPRHDQAEVALAQTAVDRVLEDPDRAGLVHVLAIHGRACLTSTWMTTWTWPCRPPSR
jgi:hypothetical protein